MLNMTALSGTRSDFSGNPPTYSTQAMSIRRTSTSKDPAASEIAAVFKSRAGNREKTSSSNCHSSPPKARGPLTVQGERLIGTEVFPNSRIIPRHSRKDGNISAKSAGLTSTHSTQGLCREQGSHDKTFSEKYFGGGFRPPRSSSSVNISASGQAVAVPEASMQFYNSGKVIRKNLNSSNDNVESSFTASDSRIQQKARDVVTASTAAVKTLREKSNDQTDSRASVTSGRSGQHQQQTNEYNSSLARTDRLDATGVMSSNKLTRSGTDYKLSKRNDESDGSASICALKMKNLDLANHFDTSAGLSGLYNLGNTCFMNSILQCLSNTRPLLEFCLLGNFSAQINTQTSSMKGAMFKAFVRLLEEIWKSSGSSHSIGSVSPTDFKYHISKYSRHFVGTREQDAHEFLVYLLEGLHEDLNRVREKKKRYIDSSDEVETISATDKAKLSWERYVECDNSEIIDIFMGQLRSALKCKKCGYVSNTFEPFLALSLPIKQAGSQVSLSDCFKLFSHEETLDGDNKPKCAKCRTRNACTKQMSIQKFPKVLIIHLMRFKQGTSNKLNTQVSCPMSGLDLCQFTTAAGCSNATYNLYAVSNHSGTPLTGHYTAYAKHPYSKQWHIFNDSRVTSISQSTVNSSDAYLLFYELQEQCLSS